MDFKALFGTSLRQCRRSRGLTQTQLAEATGLSLEMVGHLERGAASPSFDTIGALAKALGVTPAVLFGAEPSGITGERRDVLDRISALLASASDAEVKRAERILAAVFGA